MAIATYARICEKNKPGNSQIWIAEAPNITSITIAAGEVTTFTMDSGKTFQEHQPMIDQLTRTQEGVGTGSNISYLHKIDMKFAKLATGMNTMRNALADASPCGMVTVTKDTNGEYWLTGWTESDLGTRGLELRQDNDTSGTAPDDAEGSIASLILECKNGDLDLPLTSAGITSFDSAKTDA